MAKYHTVKQGEHLSKIALQYGFPDYRKIWDHPENAPLKQKRQNPNVLFPGDRLYIPDKQEKIESGATGQRHRFRLTLQPLKLRIVVKDLNDQPVTNTSCQLHIEGEIYKLTTDSQGLIEQEIPRIAERGKLTIQDPENAMDMEVPIQIGHLDPVEEVSGQVARLNNLGYKAGKLESPDPEQLRSAIEEFQCDHGLAVDGICGPQTQAKLKEIHGC